MTPEQLAKDLLAIVDSEMYVNDFGGLQAGRDATTDIHAAIGKLEEALAQPEQEPLGWHTEDHLTDRSATTYSKEMAYRWECKGWPVTPFYASPPKENTWVGLTYEELHEIYQATGTVHYKFALVEAKLKEKNT